MTLTATMRETLRQAIRQPLRRTFHPGPGKPPWPAAATTLHALVRHELLAHHRLTNRHGVAYEQWEITDAGRDALQPKVKPYRDTDDFMDRNGGITKNPRRSIDHEWIGGKQVPVARQDPEVLHPRWSDEARLRHEGARGARGRARDLRRELRRAA